MLLSLPMLYAIVRKLQALAMLIAEVSVPRAAAGERTGDLRGIVSWIILSVGVAVLVIALLLLSAPLLPPVRLLLIFIPIIALAALVMRHHLTRIYASAQIALRETLAPVTPSPAESPAALSPLLRDAHLELITLRPESAGAGKAIADLRLRTVSGASIVAIDRSGERTINPGPEARLDAGDILLLIGDRHQITSAAKLLE
jgi:CPA2 family monovalent cation:H+ antiporter-2